MGRLVFDTHAIARSLTAADLTDAQADAITDAVREAAVHDAAAVDVDALATKADVAAVQADVAAVQADVTALEARLEERMTHFATKEDLTALEARIYRAMLVQAGAIVGALVGIAGMVVGVLRLLESGS